MKVARKKKPEQQKRKIDTQSSRASAAMIRSVFLSKSAAARYGCVASEWWTDSTRNEILMPDNRRDITLVSVRPKNNCSSEQLSIRPNGLRGRGQREEKSGGKTQTECVGNVEMKVFTGSDVVSVAGGVQMDVKRPGVATVTVSASPPMDPVERARGLRTERWKDGLPRLMNLLAHSNPQASSSGRSQEEECDSSINLEIGAFLKH